MLSFFLRLDHTGGHNSLKENLEAMSALVRSDVLIIYC